MKLDTKKQGGDESSNNGDDRGSKKTDGEGTSQGGAGGGDGGTTSVNYSDKHTAHSSKMAAMKLFEEDTSGGVRRRIIAIVGDQDSDFPVETVSAAAVTDGVRSTRKKKSSRKLESVEEMDGGDTFGLPICIKLPNYLYTLH